MKTKATTKRHKILLIVTGHGQLGDTGRATGLYLSELAHPAEVLLQAGDLMEVASPEGGQAPIDPKSLTSELSSFLPLVEQTLAFRDILPEDYDAYLIIGGHGTMWDLPEHPDLQRLLISAYQANKVIAAICHGPAALVRLKLPDGHYMLEGKHVTGFSNNEEGSIGLTEVVPFLLEDALKHAGAHYLCAPNWQPQVIIDGKLVTGQNPASARGVGLAVRDLLHNPPAQ